MTTKRALRIGALAAGGAAALVLAAPGAAQATHTHVVVLANGQCVVLAEEAGEEDVVLATAVFASNPNVDIAATAGRAHPLHVLVHLGPAGEHVELYVYGTAAAAAACPDLVNRR